MPALVIAEHDHGTLKGATLNTVSAALACDREVHVLVAGHNAQAAAQAGTRTSPAPGRGVSTSPTRSTSRAAPFAS